MQPNGARPSHEQLMAELQRLQSVLGQRALQDLSRWVDHVQLCTMMADAGSLEARQLLTNMLGVLKRAETSSRGIIL